MPRVTSEFIPQAWHIQDVPAMVTDALGTPWRLDIPWPLRPTWWQLWHNPLLDLTAGRSPQCWASRLWRLGCGDWWNRHATSPFILFIYSKSQTIWSDRISDDQWYLSCKFLYVHDDHSKSPQTPGLRFTKSTTPRRPRLGPRWTENWDVDMPNRVQVRVVSNPTWPAFGTSLSDKVIVLVKKNLMITYLYIYKYNIDII